MGRRLPSSELLVLEQVEHRAHPRAVLLVRHLLLQRIELAGVQEDAMAVEAGVDLHLAPLEGLQVQTTLGALHVVQGLEFLALLGRQPLGLLVGQLALLLDFLLLEVGLFGGRRLLKVGHEEWLRVRRDGIRGKIHAPSRSGAPKWWVYPPDGLPEN